MAFKHYPAFDIKGKLMTQLILGEHQCRMVDWILRNKRCALWASMGSGKTASTLFAYSIIRITDPRPALVVAPLRVAQLVWKDEVERWSAFSDMRVSTIIGTEKQRLTALNTPADLYTINFENIPWLVKHFKDKWPFSTIIVDESTKLKSFRTHQGGKQPRLLGKVAFSKVERFIELTGTPSPNGLIDLWGQIWFLDKGQRLGRVFKSFISRWFLTLQVGSHIGAVRYLPKPLAQKEIEEKLSDCCLSLNIADYKNIDKPIQSVHKIVLPALAQNLYKKLQRELFCELQGETIEAFNSASKTIKCLQMANGAVYVDEHKNWKEAHNAGFRVHQRGGVRVSYFGCLSF